MAKTTLTISSKNYSSWSLRGWLLAKFSGLEFEEVVTAPDDASARAELLLLSSSILVPCLRHEGATVWDTLAIAEYLNEIMPHSGLLPEDRVQRAHCRSICGEIHSGFTTLRASLPVNLKGHFPGFKIWSRAQADIDRVCTIWRDCLAQSGGPFLFGERRTMADAMYAPVVTRFMTYDVKLEPGLPPMPRGSWPCRRCRNGSRRRRPSPPTSRNSRSNIRQCCHGRACLKGPSIGQILLKALAPSRREPTRHRAARRHAAKIAEPEFGLGCKRFGSFVAMPCKIAAAQRDWRGFRIAQSQAVNATMRRCRKFGRQAEARSREREPWRLQ